MGKIIVIVNIYYGYILIDMMFILRCMIFYEVKGLFIYFFVVNGVIYFFYIFIYMIFLVKYVIIYEGLYNIYLVLMM